MYSFSMNSHSCIVSSISFPTCCSLAMGTSLRLQRPFFSNPKARSSSHLLTTPPAKGGSSFPFPTLKPRHSRIQVGFSSRMGRGMIGIVARSGSGETSKGVGKDEVDEARGQSTLPERFRFLTKEAPDRPVRWPWLIALFFLVYAWRAVLWELTNWKKASLATIQFFGYLGKLALAFVFHYIGDLVTGIIRCIEFSLYSARYVYASIVAFAPVPELTRIILFASTVLAIAETTVPGSVNNQPYLLSFAGIIGFGVVNHFIPELLFWLLLSGLFCYLRYIRKRDIVSSAMPSATVLAAVGEPWVRGLVIALYLSLAILQYSNSSQESQQRQIPFTGWKIPVPLLLASLSIGIHLAAKWVRHRHLTWMIA